MLSPATQCMFFNKNCSLGKNGKCDTCDFITCDKWYEITLEQNLCPLMLKAGYEEENRVSMCDILKFRPVEGKCFEKDHCLARDNPMALQMIHKA